MKVALFGGFTGGRWHWDRDHIFVASVATEYRALIRPTAIRRIPWTGDDTFLAEIDCVVLYHWFSVKIFIDLFHLKYLLRGPSDFIAKH